ncbi:BatA domain-containing protein [uncultured Maribacter sp.]|uniref:BatA domain-containing protein n=1 Tax=uncultured Maribacter sp. TaxID=431308 RepID=UPI0030DA4145|tara:strand:- start:1503 stop:2798 length:1296 start_codon:yes stop_codon:yes gene_type:complete
MSFTYPTYLWALLGLLVPIAVHLWSKKEAKTIKIGSIQLLSESKSKQSSSIQLNELWLLLLRMLIISVLTLVLAKPIWNSRIDNASLTYLVEPDLSQNKNFMTRLDSLADEQEIRLFKKGFPLWEYDSYYSRVVAIPDYWSLASETDLLNTDSIVVFTKGYARGIKGSRPQTDHQIKWVVIDSAQTVEKPLIAYQNEKDLQLYSALGNSNKVEVSSGQITLGSEYAVNSSGDSLRITNKGNAIKVPLVIQKPLDIAIFYKDSLANDKRFFEAAFATLEEYLDREIKVESNMDTVVPKKKKYDITVWLSEKPVPNSYQKLLFYKKDSVANSLIEEGSEANTFVLTKRISAENAIEQRLVENILDILYVNKELDELVSEADIRQVTETELQTNFKPSTTKRPKLGRFNLLPYLWVLLFTLLLVERLVAYLKKQ